MSCWPARARSCRPGWCAGPAPRRRTGSSPCRTSPPWRRCSATPSSSSRRFPGVGRRSAGRVAYLGLRAPLGRRRAARSQGGSAGAGRRRTRRGRLRRTGPGRAQPLDGAGRVRVAAPAGGDGAHHAADRAGAAPLGRSARGVPPDLRDLLRVAAALLAAALDRPAPGRARGHRVPDEAGDHRAARDAAGRLLRRRAVRLLHGVPRRDRAAPPGRTPPHDVLPPDRARRRAGRPVRGGGGAAPVPSRWSSCRWPSS